MDELLDAQIRLESLRDDLRSRTDLLEKDRLRLIRRRLRYAARFYHDVFEDFERGRVKRAKDVYVIAEGCINIDNFLGSRRFAEDTPKEIVDLINKYLSDVKSGDMSRRQQHDFIDAINRARKATDPRRRRFRAVADDCFALASQELRHRMGELTKMPIGDEQQAVTNRSYSAPEVAADNG